jgi:galactonate dehydratase
VGDFVYVKLITDEGLYGIGEASLRPRSLAVIETLNEIKRALIGQNATWIEHIWQDIFRGTGWRGGPVLQSALAGIDIALWDLAGKALNVPTYRLLSGPTRDKVLVYRHLGGRIASELVEYAQQLLTEGWRVLRFCPLDETEHGFDPKNAVLSGIEKFSTLRSAIGDSVEVIFEVHTRLTPIRATELCNSITDLRPFFVEDPIRPENPGSFSTLRSHTSVPIASGEMLSHKWAFRELIEQELIDYIRVDPCHSGGITEG